MQDPDVPSSVRADLLERLKALDTDQGKGTLAELAYRRAREALEKALEEARVIRLRALDEARRVREDETESLRLALQSQRDAAEAEIGALLRQAEIEAERIRAQATLDADIMGAIARDEAANKLDEANRTLEESRALRADAEERQRRVHRLEDEFDAVIAQLLERLGITDQPSRGWLQRITQRSRGTSKH